MARGRKKADSAEGFVGGEVSEPQNGGMPVMDPVSEDIEAGNCVFVGFNSDKAQSFVVRKNDGTTKTVALHGVPVNNLIIPGGGGDYFRGGKYGVNRVEKDDWEYIKKTYGSMKMFKSGVIMEANTYKELKAKVGGEGQYLRHGFEPVDTKEGADPRVKTAPSDSKKMA